MSHEAEHEEIHMPSSSAAPLIVGAGMTLALTGLVVPGLLIVGAIILAIGVGMWAFSPN